jgi:hypothetical protein
MLILLLSSFLFSNAQAAMPYQCRSDNDARIGDLDVDATGNGIVFRLYESVRDTAFLNCFATEKSNETAEETEYKVFGIRKYGESYCDLDTVKIPRNFVKDGGGEVRGYVYAHGQFTLKVRATCTVNPKAEARD